MKETVKQKRYYQKHKAAGLCVICPDEATHGVHCKKHHEERQKKQREVGGHKEWKSGGPGRRPIEAGEAPIWFTEPIHPTHCAWGVYVRSRPAREKTPFSLSTVVTDRATAIRHAHEERKANPRRDYAVLGADAVQQLKAKERIAKG